MKLTFVFFTIAICAAMGIGLWLSFAAPLVTEQDLRELGAVPATPANQTDITSGRAQLLAMREGVEAEECTFYFTTAAVEGEGTAFTSGERLRVDVIDYAAVDSTSVTSIIITPSSTYAWSVFGTTTVAEEFAGVDKLAATELSELALAALLLQPNTSVRYTCVPWRLDASVFTAPSTLETAPENGSATTSPATEL